MGRREDLTLETGLVIRRCHGQLLGIFMRQRYLSCEAYSNIRTRKIQNYEKYLLGMVTILLARTGS